MIESSAQQPSFFESSPIEGPCFIETQFPVAKISIESYKERTAKQSQTLTGLGKWWGRKPLILVRAVLLGLLMPATVDPEKDREIFLKLLTMDSKGLLRRKDKPISQDRLLEELKKMPPGIQKKYNASLSSFSKPEKDELQRLVFERLPYSEKLEYCDRPEQIDGPSPETWAEINAHLSTNAQSLPELVQELGEKRFGHHPRVGDAFCGGGSIPFEASRLGCDTFGSDLNPVAAFLSWASLNLVGGGDEAIKRVENARRIVYDEVAKEVSEWEIETNSLGWRADAFLYCVEVIDPETGWKIPLLPSLIIGKKTNTVVRLVPDPEHKRYEIEIHQGVSEQEMAQAAEGGTDRNSRVSFPGSDHSTPIDIIRRNLRQWEKSDFSPRPTDIFQERLYCIRWLEFIEGKNGKTNAIKRYRTPNTEDQKREEKVLSLLGERFEDWQTKGYIPSRKIEPGAKTDEPIRTRGWTYWHHLFTPRQLLVLGLLSEKLEFVKDDPIGLAGALLSLGKCTDWFSKLCRWNPNAANEKTEQTFSNQALNTLSTYASRSMYTLDTTWFGNITNSPTIGNHQINVQDARAIHIQNDIWVTDPPYADAVNYEEVSEYFLAWYDQWIQRLFPDWYTDSKRSLAVKGNDHNFRKSMMDCYRQMTRNMPDNGYQLVMFTHQDSGVWADLTLILWAAGLRVTAAWTIATEISTALKEGNYVQGTVLMVLRKRTNSAPLFLDEISHQVEDEVRRQLDSMTRLEDASDPNFGDADYQLAAYAAALRVLTGQPIEEIDPEKEILRERKPGEVGPVEALIRRAVKIACDHLIPRNLNPELWKTLGPMERFYIKGLEVESHGEYRSGVYQELARGFGANDYTDLLESTKANETRLKTAFEFGKKRLGTFGSAGVAFDDSLVRQCLFSIWLTVKNEGTKEGMDYLHTELREAYWSNREKITGILEYLTALSHSSTMEHWQKDAHAASLLAGAVRNDHV
jgi:putative DNA methylase